MEPILKATASALLSYSVHYASLKAYNYLCVPDGILGYFTGLLKVGSPICQVGVKIITNTEISYSSICIMGLSRMVIDYVTFRPKV